MDNEKPRYRPGRPIGRVAVVIGASMAGLCAARVLSPRFDQVLVIDRDTLPDRAQWRGQVPQGRQPHLLLVAGARLLERWFPGIGGDLAEHGATNLDISGDFYWHQAGGAARRPPSDLRGPAMSRPLLEWTVRRHVAVLSNVMVRGSTVAAGVRLDAAAGRVDGVRLADRETIRCDLLVDAPGRRAHTLDWLAESGYQPPSTSVVDVDTCYVSQLYRRTDQPRRDWSAAAVVGGPATKRLAMALPVEGGRWIVLLGGLNGERPPTSEQEMVAFARSLDSPVIADIMTASPPLTEPVSHRFRASQRRHVESWRRFPAGLVMVGDAVASFDPIYGQGMTSAAQQAEALGDCLDRAGAVDRPFARRFFRRASKIVAEPWSIAVGGDFAYPGTTGPKPAGTDLFNRYFDRILLAWQHDDRIVIRVNEVLALLRPSTALLSPRIHAPGAATRPPGPGRHRRPAGQPGHRDHRVARGARPDPLTGVAGAWSGRG